MYVKYVKLIDLCCVQPVHVQARPSNSPDSRLVPPDPIHSVIKMLLRTPVSCKYVHLFVNELDVDLSKPGYVLDTTIISHTSVQWPLLNLCLCVCFCVSVWF